MSSLLSISRSREYESRLRVLLGDDLNTSVGEFLTLGTDMALSQLDQSTRPDIALLGPFLTYEQARELSIGLTDRFPGLGLVLVGENRAELEDWVSEINVHMVLSPTADDTTVLDTISRLRDWLGIVESEQYRHDQNEPEDLEALVDLECEPVLEDAVIEHPSEKVKPAQVDSPAPATLVRPINTIDDGSECQVIAVVSAKGGLGKTTVATNLAVGLAQSAPWSVVLVDADVQFGDVATALSLAPTYTLTDAVADPASRDTMVLKTYLTLHTDGFFTVCGAESPVDGDRTSGEQLSRLIEQLSEVFKFVIIDTAPGLGEHALAALEQATDAVLLCSMSVPSARGLRKELAVLQSIGIMPEARHVVLNFADRGSGLTVRDVEATIGVPVDVAVPRSRLVALSTNRGIPILAEGNRDPASRALTTLVRKFDPSVSTKRDRLHRRVEVA